MGDSNIAEGCFGIENMELFKGKWAAMKTVPSRFITVWELKRDCDIYLRGHHSNLVKLLEAPWQKNGEWHFALEYIVGEDLETTIFHSWKSGITLTPSVEATIITGMCEGLFFLHKNGIVHKDLKPENIMVEHGTYRAVILDMGLGRILINPFSANLEDEEYAAPETWGRRVRSEPSDVWAMGKIITEVLVKSRQASKYVSPYKIWDTLRYEEKYRDIVFRMMNSDPAMRATMAGVMHDIRQAGKQRGTVTQGSNLTVVPVQVNVQVQVQVEQLPAKLTQIKKREPSSRDMLCTNFSQMELLADCLPDGTMSRVRYDGERRQLERTEVTKKNGRITLFDQLTFNEDY